jgi:hypothetical protein
MCHRFQSHQFIVSDRPATARLDAQRPAGTRKDTSWHPTARTDIAPSPFFTDISVTRWQVVPAFSALATASHAPLSRLVDGAASPARTARFTRFRDLAVTLAPPLRRSRRGGQGSCIALSAARPILPHWRSGEGAQFGVFSYFFSDGTGHHTPTRGVPEQVAGGIGGFVFARENANGNPSDRQPL